MREFLTLEEISDLNNILLDNGFNDVKMVITFNVNSKEKLNKINEDFFYKTKQEGKIENVDEITLVNNNITFHYQISESKDDKDN